MRIKHAWLKSTSTATTYGRFHLDADGYVVDVTDVHPKMEGYRPTVADIQKLPGFSVEEPAPKPSKPVRAEKPKAEVKTEPEAKPVEEPQQPPVDSKPADAESNVAVE